MKCEEVKELLYEYIMGELQEDEQRRVQQHLESCENCRREAEEIAHTVKLLDTVKPPPISEDFKERVLRRVDKLPLPSKPFWQRVKEYLLPSQPPTLMKGLAVTLVLLVTVSILYIVPEIFHKGETGHRAIETPSPGGDPFEVPVPIIIKTEENPEQALKKLETLIDKHKGSTGDYRLIEQGVQIEYYFFVDKENEQALLEDLDELGEVHNREQKGYKGEAGNIVVRLERKEKE